MMQMFKYPQGEGGQIGCRCEEMLSVNCRNMFTRYLRCSPLRSRFVLRSMYPQTRVSMGGNGHVC